MRKTFLALSVLLFLSIPSHAASFDCAKAATPQEKAICATPDLSAADDEMAAAYKAWLAAAPGDWAAGIRDDQKSWLRLRTSTCPADRGSFTIEDCLHQFYKERIDELGLRVRAFAGVTFVSRAITLTKRDEPGSVPTWTSELTPGFGTFEATWPQVVSTAPQWVAWNSAVVAAAIKTAAPNAKPPARSWNDLVEPAVDQAVTVTVDFFNGQLISASIVNDYNGHGAHPTENSSWFYWLLDKQRELKAEDIFVPNSGWDTWMMQRLDAYLHKTLDSESQGDYQSWFPQGQAQKTLLGIVSNPEGWQLNGRGLTLVFQPYEVAGYARTPEPLTIPWSELKPYLQHGFAMLQ